MHYSDDFFKGLVDETRRRILNLLIHYPALHVNQIVQILNLPQSKISKHLIFLRKSGWVNSVRREKWVYYRLSTETSNLLVGSLQNIFKNELLFINDIKKAQEILGN